MWPMKNLRARRLPQPHTMADLIDEALCAGSLVLSSGAARIVRLLSQAGRGADARNDDRDPDRLRRGQIRGRRAAGPSLVRADETSAQLVHDARPLGGKPR